MAFLKQPKGLLLILFLFSCLPYIYISIYANPAADDFTYAFKGSNNDFIKTYLAEYINWNGRYTSNALVLLNPLAFNSFFAYKIIPVVIISFTFFSYLFSINCLIGEVLSKINRYLISFILLLLFLYQMPIISEGIYWYTGAVTYQLGNIFALIFVGLLIQYHKAIFFLGKKIIHLLVLTIILILTVGFNEVIMIILFFFSLFYFFIVYTKKLPHKTLANYLVIVTLLFSAVVYFAPGNLIRASYFSSNHHFISSFLYSMAQSLRFFLNWTSSLPLLLISILFFYLNIHLSKNIVLFSKSFYLTRLHSSVLLFFVIFIAVFPAYWSTGILGQHRTLNVAYYVFIFMWFINLTVWFNYFKNENTKSISKRTSTILLVVIITSCFFTKNGYDVITDIYYGKAQSFNQQMNERYALIVSANNKDTIYFSTIKSPPKSLFLYEISDKPQSWQNKCYLIYYECENKTLLLNNN
ncbi:MAG: DUF6056 family protein [Bacteroidia bacterium]